MNPNGLVRRRGRLPEVIPSVAAAHLVDERDVTLRKMFSSAWSFGSARAGDDLNRPPMRLSRSAARCVLCSFTPPTPWCVDGLNCCCRTILPAKRQVKSHRLSAPIFQIVATSSVVPVVVLARYHLPALQARRMPRCLLTLSVRAFRVDGRRDADKCLIHGAVSVMTAQKAFG